MPDFRIECGFTRNLKIRKMIAALGWESVGSLLNLWDYTALHNPKGIYYYSPSDIELIADWKGHAGALVAYWLKERFLDRVAEGGLAVHEWPLHNSYAYRAPERSEHSRKLALIRWEKRRRTQIELAGTSSPSRKGGGTPMTGSPSGQVNSKEINELLEKARIRKKGKG